MIRKGTRVIYHGRFGGSYSHPHIGERGIVTETPRRPYFVVKIGSGSCQRSYHLHERDLERDKQA